MERPFFPVSLVVDHIYEFQVPRVGGLNHSKRLRQAASLKEQPSIMRGSKFSVCSNMVEHYYFGSLYISTAKCEE